MMGRKTERGVKRTLSPLLVMLVGLLWTTSSCSGAVTTTTLAVTSTVAAQTTTTAVPPTTTPSTELTTTTVASVPDYLTVSHALALTLQAADARMPELATIINSTLPQVPQPVRDELDGMLTNTLTAADAVSEATCPAGQAEADAYLRKAAAAMGRRIQATIGAIDAMWPQDPMTAGSIAAAGPYFSRGRTERDRYRSLFASYQRTLGVAVTTTPTAGPSATWRKSSMTLKELRITLAQGMAHQQTIYLPDHLPAGWAVAAPNQHYGRVGGGYFKGLVDNPEILNDPFGGEQPLSEYTVCFTDGKELIGLMAAIGDWGDGSPGWTSVIASGQKVELFEDPTMIAVDIPAQWEQPVPTSLVGTPGARDAALEIAGALRRS